MITLNDKERDEIAELMSLEDRPDWLRHGHDHICKIPHTESYVFYPYNEDEADEEYLNGLFSTYMAELF